MSAGQDWPAVRVMGDEQQLEAWEERVAQLLPEDVFLGSARQVWYDPDAPAPELELAAGALVLYLRPGSDMVAVVEALRQASDGSVEIEPFLTPEADWATQWRRFFRPIAVSERLAIIPSWYTVEEAAAELEMRADSVKWIRIEPGQAFGSGTHATTRLCLRALERSMDATVLRVLDFGAGSGILTVAVAALGAQEVTAVEIDPETVENFNDNQRLNADHLAACRVDHRIGSSEQLGRDERFDLVVCNALYHRVAEHFPALVRSVARRGLLLYSGFLNTEREAIAQRLETELGMRIERHDSEEEWGALLAFQIDC